MTGIILIAHGLGQRTRWGGDEWGQLWGTNSSAGWRGAVAVLEVSGFVNRDHTATASLPHCSLTVPDAPPLGSYSLGFERSSTGTNP